MLTLSRLLGMYHNHLLIDVLMKISDTESHLFQC